VALARAVEAIPGPNALPGGTVWEPKLDGYRGVIVRGPANKPSRAAGPNRPAHSTASIGSWSTRIWSRNHRDLSEWFPDVARAAAAQLPPGTVIDGVLVILIDGRLSFDALQRRLVTTPPRARQLIAQAPASFIGFDLLAVDGVDVRQQRWTTRRRRLESLAATWTPPLQPSLVIDNLTEAEQWFDVLGPVGVEGLVAKGKASRYQPGRRGWLKIKHRDTVEIIVGGVLGSLDQPTAVIAGRYRGAKNDAVEELVQVGRTVPLTTAQSTALAEVLRPAHPDHPWPDQIGVSRWGRSGAKVPLIKVDPTVVVEVSTDAALQAGQWRHGLRFLRTRPDLQPADVPTLPTASYPSCPDGP
jgi:ATP-dependent DNA ligase